MKNPHLCQVILVLGLLFLSRPIKAQDECNCRDQFEKMSAYISENYPFYTLKVTAENQKSMNAYNKLFLKKSKETSVIEECQELLSSYLDIYRDGHLFIVKIYSAGQKLDERWAGDLSDISSGSSGDSLIGKWSNGNYNIAIIPAKEPNYDYLGVLLNSPNENWNAGDIKLKLSKKNGELRVHFGMIEKDMAVGPAKLVSGKGYPMLRMDGIGTYFKEGKGKEEISVGDNNRPVVFTQLTSKTYLMKIRTFGGGVKKTIDSLVKVNHKAIIGSENLIVDVRDNSGGNDSSYYEILPYIYSDSVTLPGVGYYLSPENKEMFMGWWPEDSENGKAIRSMEDYSIYTPQNEYVHKLDSLYTSPKRIAILQNNKTISSGETFVLRTRQSDKVTVYGVNSAGIVDGFNGRRKDLGCLYLRHPTTYRSYKLPEDAIDPYGIAPDIYMKSFMEDPYPFITQHLELMDD